MSSAPLSRHASAARLAKAAALALAAALLAACATPDKPVRPALYDLGPTPVAGVQPSAPSAMGAARITLTPVVLGDVEATGSFDGSAILYRLGYADAHQLRPYARARWSSPPAQLVREALRERLARDRPVLDRRDSIGLASDAAPLRTLRVDVEEFTHYFESTVQSAGVLRLRCTVTQNSPAGEQFLAQRTFELQHPASSPDAAGGVQALAAATSAAADEIAAWLLAVQ